jgi:4-amino-4-deoxychorismate lyase
VSKAGALDCTAYPTGALRCDPMAASFLTPVHHPTYDKPILTICLDSRPSESSTFTSTKTTKRTIYDDARLRADLPPVGSPTLSAGPSDVLLYNHEGHITETTIYNIAFYRSCRWVTPPMSTGCLPGVFRRLLIDQGRINEMPPNTIHKDSIQDDDLILLFNSVQGCLLGRVALRANQLPRDHESTFIASGLSVSKSPSNIPSSISPRI